MKKIASLNHTKALLEKYQLNAKISLGQNFLIDENTVTKIVSELEPSDNVAIIEVGPGLGALSAQLLEICNKLISIEIDQNMVEILKDIFEDEAKIEIIHEDILNVDLNSMLSTLKEQFDKVYFVSNLPYYITSDILMRIFGLEHKFDIILVMVQSEFADRLVCQKDSKDYRPITVVSKTFYKSKKLFNISKNVFYPKPKIVSSIVRLEKNDTTLQDHLKYTEFVNLCFTQKRKTIYNNLRVEFSEESSKEILSRSNIELNSRPAQLDIKDYIRMYEVYYETEVICKG